MSETAEKDDPALWERVKAEIIAGAKGGKPGQWSARKAQFAVQEYKRLGGGYRGGKDPHNHLIEWQDEEWGTKSGAESLDSGERYLPKKVREAMSDEEYGRTTAAKRRDLKAGQQFSRNPPMSRPRRAGSATARRPRPISWPKRALATSQAAPE
jgi:hypothetical protein